MRNSHEEMSCLLSKLARGQVGMARKVFTRYFNADLEVGVGLLLAAVRSGNVETVEAVLSLGVPVCRADSSGITPLHVAAENGDLFMCAFLVDKGADVFALDDYDRRPRDMCEPGESTSGRHARKFLDAEMSEQVRKYCRE